MTTKLSRKDFQILKERDITNLIHFTPLTNLERILQDGLKPCKYNTKEENILNRNTRLCIDNEFVSFSIEHSNYMYLNSLLEKYNTKIVILVFSSNVLLGKTLELHKSNPAIPRWGIAKSLEDLFFEKYRFNNLPSKYPTDPRAEIKIKGDISKSYLKEIHFSKDTKKEFKIYKQRYPELLIRQDDSLFLPRIDDSHWKEIRKNGIDIFPLNNP
jgi:hypothetical protein